MNRWLPWEALALIALSVDFATSYLMVFIWKSLPLHAISILIFSFLGGAFFVNFNKSVVRVTVSYIIGVILSLLISVLPPIIYGGEPRQISMGFDLNMIIFARIFIVSFPTCIVATLFGCFIAQAHEVDDKPAPLL